jgi:hypothetical protein
MNLFIIKNNNLKKQINITNKRPESLELFIISYLSLTLSLIYQSLDFRLLNKSNIPNPKEFDSDK